MFHPDWTFFGKSECKLHYFIGEDSLKDQLQAKEAQVSDSSKIVLHQGNMKFDDVVTTKGKIGNKILNPVFDIRKLWSVCTLSSVIP
ncbi:hypothetical protein LEP1GSC108_0399 [Leptospira weilii str. UI 13098]|uniref:Uncharacterized protein n=1 Tax=Leptospira weilii str. UI 13098 TaxID=1088542 RepID=M6Q1Q8_9LEPT|nr:hypothetical protein LEP1GSC108_0399 [Leptospira weilii str. UI 13098]